MSKCPHCSREVDNPRFTTCSICRQKSAAYSRERRRKQLAGNHCLGCNKEKAADGFSYCLKCREKSRQEYIRHHKMTRRKKPPLNPVRTKNNKKVQMRVEYVKILEEKAAETGTTRQGVLAELINRYIDEVIVW